MGPVHGVQTRVEAPAGSRATPQVGTAAILEGDHGRTALLHACRPPPFAEDQAPILRPSPIIYV